MKKHSVSHDLGEAKAREAAEAAFASYKEKLAQYDPRAKWVSDTKSEISFSVKGIKLRGALEVTGDSIDIELQVPLLLRPFQGQALKVIENEVRGWVDKARAGEL